MELIVIIAIIVGITLIRWGIMSYNHKTYKQNREQALALYEQALARYEKIRNGEFSESDLNEQEKELLQKLRTEKACNDFGASQLLLWAFLMHNHDVLPQRILQTYEVDLQTSYPQVYETYQQCYNSYCYYNSGGSYTGYSGYSSY